MKKHWNCLILVLISACLLLFLVDFKTENRLEAQNASSSETSTDPNQPNRNRVESFFNELMSASTRNSTKTAFEDLFFRDISPGTRASSPSESIETMSSAFFELRNSDVGIMHSSEYIDSKNIGNDLVLMRYLSKHENAPILWYFTFYRSQQRSGEVSSPGQNSNWNLIQIRFDSNLEPLLLKF